MIKNSKVLVQIEYERDGESRNFCGEIDENKLKDFRAEEESFICVRNDGKIAWLDKEAILSVYELETKLCVYEKNGTEDAYFAIKQSLKIRP